MGREIVGQYYFIPEDGKLKVSPYPKLVINGEVTEEILMLKAAKAPDWRDEVWKEYLTDAHKMDRQRLAAYNAMISALYNPHRI